MFPTSMGMNHSETRIHKVVDFIEDHLSHELRLDSLAAETSFSTFQFLRAFKTSTGLTPHQFVLHRRPKRAKEMLMQSHNNNHSNRS